MVKTRKCMRAVCVRCSLTFARKANRRRHQEHRLCLPSRVFTAIPITVREQIETLVLASARIKEPTPSNAVNQCGLDLGQDSLHCAYRVSVVATVFPHLDIIYIRHLLVLYAEVLSIIQHTKWPAKSMRLVFGSLALRRSRRYCVWWWAVQMRKFRRSVAARHTSRWLISIGKASWAPGTRCIVTLPSPSWRLAAFPPHTNAGRTILCGWTTR